MSAIVADVVQLAVLVQARARASYSAARGAVMRAIVKDVVQLAELVLARARGASLQALEVRS